MYYFVVKWVETDGGCYRKESVDVDSSRQYDVDGVRQYIMDQLHNNNEFIDGGWSTYRLATFTTDDFRRYANLPVTITAKKKDGCKIKYEIYLHDWA